MSKKKTFLVLGTHIWDGPYGNLGVTALATAVTQLLGLRYPQTEVAYLGFHSAAGEQTTLYPGGKATEIRLIKTRMMLQGGLRNSLVFALLISFVYRLLPIQSLRNFLRRQSNIIEEVVEAEGIGDICGGDSFSDIYGLKRFLTNYLLWYCIHNLGRRIIHFPQTYGPYKSWLARRIARHMLKHASLIMARDQASLEVVKRIYHKDARVVLSPDVAFALTAQKPAALKLVNAKSEERGVLPDRFIGFNVNGLMYHGGYTRSNQFGLAVDYPKFVTSLIETILAQTDYKIVLVPHTLTKPGNVESDNGASMEIVKAFGPAHAERLWTIDSLNTCHELKWVIQQSEYFIGSRMHSCIAAISQGIPCSALAYSMKFKGVFATVGMGDYVLDGAKVGNEEAISSIMQAVSNVASIKSRTSLSSGQTKARLREIFETL